MPTDGPVPPFDVYRNARVHIIRGKPRLVLEGLSPADLMLISAYRFLENHQWDKASRAIARADRMQREERAQASFTPASFTPASFTPASFTPAAFAPAGPRPPARAISRPPATPTPPPGPQAPPGPEALSDRELWLRMKALRRRRHDEPARPIPRG